MSYLASILIGLTIFIATHFYLKIRNAKQFQDLPKTVLKIRANKENEKSAMIAENIFSILHSTTIPENVLTWFVGKNAPTFSFEIASINQYIYFYVWCVKKYKNTIKNQLYAQYPEIEVQEIDDYTSMLDNKNINSVCAELETTDPYILPIKRYPEFEDKTAKLFLDPLASIAEAFSKLDSEDEQLWAQMVVSPIDSEWRHRGEFVAKNISGGFRISSAKYKKWFINMMLIRNWRRVFYYPIRAILTIIGLSSRNDVRAQFREEVEKSHTRETSDQAISGKLSKLGFYTNIRFVYLTEGNEHQAENKLKEIISSFYQFNIPRLNSFTTRVLNKNNKTILKRYKNRSIVNPFIFNSEELATLWHMPNETVATPNIDWIQSKRLEPPLNLPTPKNTANDDFTSLGNTNFRGESKLFGIKTTDRRRHIYIIGKTGMGKTTILENMIFSDIQNGKGVGVIDPHGDLSEAILNFIPKNRTNDVIIFDPSDKEFPVSFNMMECPNPENRNLIASGLIGVFKKMFGESWGPRLEHILRNTLLALTFTPNSTMLGIMKMLTDGKYRNRILKKVTDPIVLDFWKNEFGKWTDKQIAENVSPIQNKVGQFLSSSTIRNILGQPKSSVHFRFVMDNKKIIIVNLSKGKIGEDNSALLGSILVTKFQLDAMSRADIPEEKRKDFHLYVDEFQNFATDSFATILSEARKYKLNLTMANQYIAQMPEEVRDAVFGNVGSTLCCQVGADDAEYLSLQFSEEVLANDIVNLPKYQSYIRLMIDGMPSKIFSCNNLPPPKLDNITSVRENIIKFSRERYSKKREFVEKKILEWSEDPK